MEQRVSFSQLKIKAKAKIETNWLLNLVFVAMWSGNLIGNLFETFSEK